MTILGVLGCVSLLLLALGIRDTINHVALSVYEETFNYQQKLELNEATITAEFLQQVTENEFAEFIEERLVFISSQETAKSSFIRIIEDHSETINFYNDGNRLFPQLHDVLITRRTAEIYGLEVGDTLEFRAESKEIIRLEVSHIIPINIGQGIYLTQSTWEYLGQAFNPTSILAQNEANIGLTEYIQNTTETHLQRAEFLDSMNSTLSMLLILAASLLLLVVLYNLGVLNFADRERNLATLSVLGCLNIQN